MDQFEEAAFLLPPCYRDTVLSFRGRDVEEIRLRYGQAPSLFLRGKERSLSLPPVGPRELHWTLEKASGASLHAVREELLDGYLCFHGLRVGVCGAAAVRSGQLSGFRQFSSLAIRIPRECRGILDGLDPVAEGRPFANTLLLSPPGGGKTTALREMIRLLSVRGTRVGVVDERNELSGMDGAGMHFDLGPCADVLVSVPKPRAAMMLLRAMTPQVIAMDEITREEDMAAIREVTGCGVGLIASVHGSSAGELKSRAEYRRLLEEKIFSRTLTITGSGTQRRYELEEIK